MTKEKDLALKLSKIRQQLNELSALEGDELTAEKRTEMRRLTDEYPKLEEQWRAASLAASEETEERASGKEPGGETGEGNEIRKLMATATVENIVSATLEQRMADGAERELQDALHAHEGAGYAGGNVIPWALLLPAEQRAPTTSSNNDGPTRQVPIIDRLFRPTDGILDMLGLGLMSSGPGQTEYPLVRGGTGNVGQTLETTPIGAAGQMQFNFQTLKPVGRLSGSYELTAELRASVAGIEAALRRDLAALVEELMIEQVFVGDGQAPNVTGLLSRIAAPSSPPTTEATFGEYAGLAAHGVDGRHATDETDVDVLLPIDAYRHAAGVIAAGTETAAIKELKSRCKRCRITAFLPPAAGGISNSIILHSAGMNGGAQRYDSLGVMWSAGPNLIVDRVSQAGKGTTVLTHISVWNVFVGFRAAYHRLSLKITSE